MNILDILHDPSEYPLIDDDGRQLLRELVEHPHAPRFNYACGDRLTLAGRDQVRAFEEQVLRTAAGPAGSPEWLDEFVARTIRTTPAYRRRVPPGSTWPHLPTVSRQDLQAGVWEFVPDGADLADLVVHATSGTTARPLPVPHHPTACAQYLPLLRAVMRRRGLTLDGGPGRTAIALICVQRSTITCATIATYLGQAGFVKVNLAAADWRSPDDPAAYLDAVAPEIFTGDPLAFTALAAVPLTHRPKALLSTAMHLTPGLRARLENHFRCPVLDYYSLLESGPVASAGEAGRLLPLASDLHVEVLDEDGGAVPEGEFGEITLTGGRNPYLPLLRYRTGDWAVLQRAPDGRRELHSLCPAEEIRETLQAVFGAAINVQIQELDPSEAGEKWVPYISDCHPLLPYSGSWTT